MPGYKGRTTVTDKKAGGRMRNLVPDIVSGNERFYVESSQAHLKSQSGKLCSESKVAFKSRLKRSGLCLESSNKITF